MIKISDRGSVFVKKDSLRKVFLTAMFIAIGFVLPFFTGQIQKVGNMLLPMHLPVFLCGLICGWQYGLFAGFILPLMRSALFSMPPMFPQAVAMAFELAAYGFVSGLLYGCSKWKCMRSLLRALCIAAVSGRIVWGTAMFILLHGAFTWETFVSGAFLTAIPGIILQFVMIPGIMTALGKTKYVMYTKNRNDENGTCSKFNK